MLKFGIISGHSATNGNLCCKISGLKKGEELIDLRLFPPRNGGPIYYMNIAVTLNNLSYANRPIP